MRIAHRFRLILLVLIAAVPFVWNRISDIRASEAHPDLKDLPQGLAVLTEFLTQSTGVERLRRLADRAIAIKMAEDGANFVDLFRFLRARDYDDASAFDAARRVCRGGLVEGGAPFTKDVCYLDGLLRVTNFLRVASSCSRNASW